MGATIAKTFTVGINVDGEYEFTHGEAATSKLTLKEGKTYRFDCSDTASIPLFSITQDGSHTDTDGEGTMGEQSVDGITYYLNGVALEDIAEGDDATTQFKAGLALGAFHADDNALGFTSLYFDVEAGSLEKKTMYTYDSDTEAMGASVTVHLASIGSSAENPSYRDGTEHHPAPAAYRLAGKGKVRSAALQGIEQEICHGQTTGARRGSNTSGHPPVAGGNGMVGGGSKGLK